MHSRLFYGGSQKKNFGGIFLFWLKLSKKRVWSKRKTVVDLKVILLCIYQFPFSGLDSPFFLFHICIFKTHPQKTGKQELFGLGVIHILHRLHGTKGVCKMMTLEDRGQFCLLLHWTPKILSNNSLELDDNKHTFCEFSNQNCAQFQQQFENKLLFFTDQTLVEKTLMFHSLEVQW